MARAIGIAVLLVAGLGVCLVGCGDDKPAAKPAPAPAEKLREVTPIGEGGKAVAAQTPKEAWLNFNEATHTGDRLLLLSSVIVAKGGEEYAATEFGVAAGQEILRRELAKEYGEESVEGSFNGVDTEPFDREAFGAKTKVEVAGDTATVQMPEADPIQAVKKADGGWAMDLSKMPIPAGDELAEVIRQNKAMIYAINAIRPKIGSKSCPTAERILELMRVNYDGYLKGSR
ncbi:hypothetical protein HQ560_13875 [bacterium]|nr:hypothetical protein [bacterium]